VSSLPLGVREVLLVVRAQNMSSGVLRNIAGDFNALDRQAKSAAQTAMQQGTALMAVGAGIAAVGAAGIAFLAKATSDAVEYNKQVALTKTQMFGVKASFDQVAQAGIDVAKAEQKGQLEIRPWESAYLRGNRFDQYAMLDLIKEVLEGGRASGFPMTRLWANMEWALEDLPGVHDIVEYETRLNEFLPQYDDVVVCTYDLSKFSAPVVMDIMRTHPQVIVGGVLQENPFYVPPKEFLAELSGRPR